MNFVYEDISKEDFEKFGIGVLAKKYGKDTFRKWSVNDTKDAYMFHIKTPIMPEDEDFGTAFYVMYINGLWVDFETETIAYGGSYGGETWEKNGIKKIAPFIWDDAEHKVYLKQDELTITYETIVSEFCDAFTAMGLWWHHKSIKHDVFFENHTQTQGA